MNAPCYKCEDRCPACHDRCERYKEWKSVEDRKKESVRDACLTETDIMHISNIYKTKRRNNIP